MARVVFQVMVGALLVLQVVPQSPLTDKVINAMEDLTKVLNELKSSVENNENNPTPEPGTDLPSLMTELTNNMTATLKELTDAIKNNTDIIKKSLSDDDMDENDDGDESSTGQPKPPKCDPPFYKHKSECFYVNKHKRATWIEARKFCQELQGDLAEPNSVNGLRALLLDKFPEDEHQFFWVGASEAGRNDGNFTWVSSKPVAAQEWAANQPDQGNENCVVLSRDEYPALHDSPCYTRTTFICERMLTGPQRVSPTPPPNHRSGNSRRRGVDGRHLRHL